VHSAGKLLQQARLRKQLSIDEAARATRMRPDKIYDLENDNYTNFPNVAYAKGFLQLYARFLGVDVSEFTDTMENANPVAIDEYEYLNAPHHRERPVAYYAPPKKTSVMPLLIGALVLIAAAIVMYLFVSFQRLGNLEKIAEKKDGGVEIASATPAVATPVPSASAFAPAIASDSISPAPAPSTSPDTEASQSPAAPAFAAASPVPLSIAPSPAPAPISQVSAPPAPVPKEVTVKSLKKVWVKIRRDVPDSPPIFEDWLYPDAHALKLRGARFWIETQDPSTLVVTKDGLPVASSSNSSNAASGSNQPTITIE